MYKKNIIQNFYRQYYLFSSNFNENKFLYLFLLFVFIIRLHISFLGYLDFRYGKFKNVNAKVVNQYIKHGKRGDYYVLKLKNSSLMFYTTSRENLKNIINENVKLTIITSKISFKDYMFTFYAPSFNIKLLPVSKADEYIEKQHPEKETADVFKALFLGESISHKTRQELSTLGVSHLVALSGLHLGFLSVFLYVFLTPFYKLFQTRFPYRNRFADLAAAVFVIEFLYLYITGFPPSLIRAYILEIVVFLYAYNLQNPFSLKVLITVFFLSLIIFGSKVFSLGYFLSILGVFYIYLFFRYYRPTFINSVILSFYMFLNMFVVSHMFFGNFNLYQLFSPVINILFTLFYPFEIFLHMIGFGGVFDSVLEKFLHFGDYFVTVKIPLWFGLFFILGSVFAFFSKKLFYGINLVSLLIIFYAIGVYVV